MSYRCAKFGAFVNSVTILTLRDLTKMASHYETPRAVNRTAPQFRVLGCSKQKAFPNNIMAYRAQPSGTIMASKRVEIGFQRRP